MRSTEIELHWNDLSSGVGLNVGGVVFKLETFAQPEVAGCWVVVGLVGGDLQLSLDVAVGV